jgi:general secretion pathway protein C
LALDALLKRYFPAVVLVLVALAAYFQASGAMELFGAALTPDEAAYAARGAPGPASTGLSGASRGSSRGEKNAEPILARNPFDSVTGPLNIKPLDISPTPAARVDLSDPLSAPGCDGMRVAIITESPDPEWSLVALQAPGEAAPKLRRVGDEVTAGKQIAYIGYNPKKSSPAVWISGDSALCQALLFAVQPTVPPPAPAPAPGAPPAAPAPAAPGGPSPVPADIASRIQKVSDTEYNVDRAVVDKILENQAELMRSARIVPEQKDGKVVGIRLFGIRPDTLLGTLGFQNGDRLEAINGFNMASPEKALEAYARLRTASNLNVKINRRGQTTSIDYRIK